MECPNSSLCYSIEAKPFWEPVKYKGKNVFLFCPSCEVKFGEGDQIRVERGLKLCPNCMAELKPIQFGKTPDCIIVDEFATARDKESAVNQIKLYQMNRAYEYVAKNTSKNGDEDTLAVCIISDLLRLIRDHNI